MATNEPSREATTNNWDIELLKLDWQKKTYWWDWSGRLLAPLIAATAVALIGARFLADLKPIHLETGSVSFDVPQTEESCICRNTVRKSRMANEGPLDFHGRPCALSPTAIERNDRSDIGEPYYLTSDFEPHNSVQDRRCYRRSVVHVRHSFSKIPRVSLQLSWMDAITHDATDENVPILVGGNYGQPLIQKVLNVRFNLQVENVTTEGFDIVLKTWYDSRIYAAEVSYVAFIQ